jgi:hypothetical protein
MLGVFVELEAGGGLCGQGQEVQTIVQDRYCSISVCVDENIDEASNKLNTHRESWIDTGHMARG